MPYTHTHTHTYTHIHTQIHSYIHTNTSIPPTRKIAAKEGSKKIYTYSHTHTHTQLHTHTHSTHTHAHTYTHTQIFHNREGLQQKMALQVGVWGGYD